MTTPSESLAEYLRRLIDTAPPLSERQRAVIAAAFRPDKPKPKRVKEGAVNTT